MGRSRLVFLICVYNEKKTIFKIIRKCKKIGDVIVVDDGSDDGSSINLKKTKRIYYIKNKSNIGYDKSIRKGFSFAFKKKYKYLVTVDGDNQHKHSDIKKISKLITKKYDCVYSIRDNFANKLELLLSVVTRFKFNVKDILCGLKAYNLEKCKSIKNKKSFLNNNIGVFYFLNIIKDKENTTKELKIKIKERVKDKSRFYRNFSSNFILIKLSVAILFSSI